MKKLYTGVATSARTVLVKDYDDQGDVCFRPPFDCNVGDEVIITFESNEN